MVMEGRGRLRPCYSSLNTAQLHTCTMNADGSAVILVTMMILRFVFGVKIVPY